MKRPKALTVQIMWIIHQIYAYILAHAHTHTHTDTNTHIPLIRMNIQQFSKMRYAFQMFHFPTLCSFSLPHTLTVRVLVFVLFFFSGLIFLFSFPLVKNDRNITLRFLNIRICYLRWDVRGTNFRFVLSI